MKDEKGVFMGPQQCSPEELVDLLEAVQGGIEERQALYTLVLFLVQSHPEFEVAMERLPGFKDAYELIKSNYDLFLVYLEKLAKGVKSDGLHG